MRADLLAQAEPPLLDRLALPRRLHERHGTRTLVVFDEFQDMLTATDRVDAVICSEIQHHGDAIHTAVKVLEDRGEITSDPSTRTGYRLTDPLLAAWTTGSPPRTLTGFNI